MKRLFFVFLFFNCFFLSSCTQGAELLLDEQYATEEYLPAYDMQVNYSVNGTGGRICKANDVYYYADQQSGYIYYYDEKSENSGKLCGKPECDHAANTCNAYIGVWASTMQVYDGYIYYISENGTLYRMDLTGNARESVMQFVVANTMNLKVVLHRGYVYWSQLLQIVEDGRSKYHYILQQAPIGKKEKTKNVLEQTIETGIPLEYWWIQGNILYQYVADVYSLQDRIIVNFYKYDSATGQLKVVEKGEDRWGTVSFAVDGDNIRKVQCNKLGEWRIVEGKQEIGVQLSNELYKTYKVSKDRILEYREACKKDEPPTYRLLDFFGKVIKEGILPRIDSVVGMYSCIGQDEKGFLLEIKGMGEDKIILVRVPYDDGEVKILIGI